MGPSGLAVTMHSLRDAPGVIGSVLWAPDGSLVAADLSPPRSEAVMQAVAARLQRLVEAHASVGALLEGLTLRYDACCVHICGVANASLAVLLGSPSQLPALKLMLGHVVRELCRTPELAALAVPPQQPTNTTTNTTTATTATTTTTTITEAASGVNGGRKARLYRGRSVE